MFDLCQSRVMMLEITLVKTVVVDSGSLFIVLLAMVDLKPVCQLSREIMLTSERSPQRPSGRQVFKYRSCSGDVRLGRVGRC